MDYRPILKVIGVFLMIVAFGMAVPAIVDLASGHMDWQVFAVAGTTTLFMGAALVLSNEAPRFHLTIREAFVMTTLVWVVVTLFGALPFMFSELALSFTDAYFESMSGVTTTGSTVIVGLDKAPPGILLWRGILQWLGGLGIIVMAISVLPMLRVGGMQLFRIEAFDTGTKAMPRVAQISGGISVIYIVLTVLCAFALWGAGMTGVEATVHAMTTIATGGYSTSDGSVGHFDSAVIDVIITIGMVTGGIPFLLLLKAARGEANPLLTDSQVRWYLGILSVGTLAIALWLWHSNGMHIWESLRYSAFNVVSVMTGTGYASTDYGLWGTFPTGIMFFLMFIGGCAGSTACGMKVFRFQILFAASRAQIRRLVQPHGIFVPYFNKRPISEEVINSVLGYFFLFGVVFALLAIALTAFGLDLVTAVTGAATAMANVGPGLGPIIGPAGTFTSLPDGAKWLLSAGMLIGRLEVFAVMALLSRSFWRS